MGRGAGSDKGLDSKPWRPHIASMPDSPTKPADKPAAPANPAPAKPAPSAELEYGGPKGPEPTRYGDWEKNGRCSDF
jgi:hypothetical protein